MAEHAQDWASAFAEDKARAEARRQAAHAQAQHRFEAQREHIWNEHLGERQMVQDEFALLSDKPEHRDYPQAAANMRKWENSSPDFRPAHEQLDKAIREADAAYHAEVRALKVEHSLVTDGGVR